MKFQNLKFKIESSKLLFLIYFLITSFFIFHFSFFAQAVSISPLKHTVVIDPGSSQDVSFVVTNDSDSERVYNISLDGFRIDPKTGRAVFGQTSRADKWFSFLSGSTFVLEPRQSKEVVASITVPGGEEPNTYYIGVFAQESFGEGGDVRFGSRVGTLVFLSVAGIVNEELEVDYFTPTSFISTQPPSFQLQLSNNGTIVTPYKGVVVVHKSSGREVVRVPLSDETQRVYAGMKKEDSISIGNLSWRDIGFLRASIIMQYGVGVHTVSASTTFWYLPVWSYFVGLLFVLLLIFVFIFVKRRYK